MEEKKKEEEREEVGYPLDMHKQGLNRQAGSASEQRQQIKLYRLVRIQPLGQ